jgi:hypothetical protein
MTFLRESVALPVARSLTHHHALRRVASRVFAFRLGPAGIVSSGGTGISELGTRDRYVSIAVLSFGEALSRLPLFSAGARALLTCCVNALSARGIVNPGSYLRSALLSSATACSFDDPREGKNSPNLNQFYAPFFPAADKEGQMSSRMRSANRNASL